MVTEMTPTLSYVLLFFLSLSRHEFDSEQIPDLSKEAYRQDIHSVGSLCKLYFRELPNPLLTYQLYERFSVRPRAVKLGQGFMLGIDMTMEGEKKLLGTDFQLLSYDQRAGETMKHFSFQFEVLLKMGSLHYA